MVLQQLLFAVAVVCFAVTINSSFDVMIYADNAGERILFSRFSKERDIISKNWYYSYRAAGFEYAACFMPLFFFIQSWYVARAVIGEMVLLLVLIFSAVFMCRGIGMRQRVLLIADLVYVTISAGYYQFVIERSYVFLLLQTMFATLRMMFRLNCRRQRRERWYNRERIRLDKKQIVFWLISTLLAILL